MCPIWLTFGDLFSVHIATHTLVSSQGNWLWCQSINKTEALILGITKRRPSDVPQDLDVMSCSVNIVLECINA